MVEVQEKSGMITSYLAGIIMLQFAPFGEKKKNQKPFLNGIGKSGLCNKYEGHIKLTISAFLPLTFSL